MAKQQLEGIQFKGHLKPEYQSILTPEAQAFLIKLHRTFNERRQALLKKRAERQRMLDDGIMPDFLPETVEIRRDPSWRVASIPNDLQKRWVEITGPTERKMMINALNSGADIFLADFEDALSPTWSNVVEGQINLIDAIDRTISFTSPEGKEYALKGKTAVLIVRPRGWHLNEKHVIIDDEQMSGSLFDFGLYFFHNAKRLLKAGSGPYFYLPKIENHLEARLWNDVFLMAQEALGVPRGTIRATVLIETILAVFEMDEILFELKEHSAGLNAGRWDYLFSIIKKFRNQEGFVFPDRAQLTMTVPFMRAYTELLVKTCHKRGAQAMGGMAAFIPSRKDKEVNEMALRKVREDKLRESQAGFDGTWVAHPDLVPVAMEVFQSFLKGRPNQIERQRDDVEVTNQELLDFRVQGGKITEAGLRQNVNVGLQYLESWLRGQGAVALYNLMEDAATCEISRAQLWQWVHQPNGILNDGREITVELFRQVMEEELAKIKTGYSEQNYFASKFAIASQLMDKLVSERQFAEFMTLSAYKYLD